MSDIGDGYSGEQSFQTEENFQQMLPGESEADWLKRLRGAGFKVAEFSGPGVSNAAPGFTDWSQQIGKTSGTGNGSTNIGGTTSESMKRGTVGGGTYGSNAGSGSSYANALAGLMAANGSSGGGSGGGMGGGQAAQHSNWSQGMGMGTMLTPMSNDGTSGSGPGAVYDPDGVRLAQQSRQTPGSMTNILRQLLERPTWINSKYTNQVNPYDSGGFGNAPAARNYLNQLMQAR